jgi:hypothetical protein
VYEGRERERERERERHDIFCILSNTILNMSYSIGPEKNIILKHNRVPLFMIINK